MKAKKYVLPIFILMKNKANASGIASEGSDMILPKN